MRWVETFYIPRKLYAAAIMRLFLVKSFSKGNVTVSFRDRMTGLGLKEFLVLATDVEKGDLWRTRLCTALSV